MDSTNQKFTLWGKMVEAARAGIGALAESRELVGRYLLGQQTLQGGFKDRHGNNDLYYTVFGFEGLRAVSPPEEVLKHVATGLEKYLWAFKGGEGLDLVHLCCLARCWAALADGQNGKNKTPENWREEIRQRLAAFRSLDGGFNMTPGSSVSTVYSSFLGVGGYQDLGCELPDLASLENAIIGLQLEDGGWSNAPRGLPQTSSTNATAAAISALASCSLPVPENAGQWLLGQVHRSGGFTAGLGVPMPDLLSTATSLQALASMRIPLHSIREHCIDFIDSLWTNQGGFHGHWLDDELDCEYTFYGLLALGHLQA